MDNDHKKGPKAVAGPDVGMTPTYYPGQYKPEPAGYSWQAKLLVFILMASILAFIAWGIYSSFIT